MPIQFGHLCNLLSCLEEITSHDPPHSPGERRHLYKDAIKRWTSRHDIDAQTPLNELVAFLSALLPHKRTDRVYNIQHQRLVGLLKRCLGLGIERARMLDRWKEPGRGDLAECVERVLRQTDDPPTLAKQFVTLVEVDHALTSIAARSRFSSTKIKQRENDARLSVSLEQIYRRLLSRDAKWLTRMILKDFTCLDVEASMVYTAINPRLVSAMRMYDEFETALKEVQRLPSKEVATSGPATARQTSVDKTQNFQPCLGVKVGPPKWVKAHGGVEHVLTLSRGRVMSVEHKIDGEYCQIHVDLGSDSDSIRIFSKSGKDSTTDRSGVLDAIKQGLRIGQADCRFRQRCILEGELVVWSEEEKRILEFHKIRKHVSRSGTYIGTGKDSQAHPWERLMIMFYDVMLIDHDPIIQKPYECRRAHLKNLVARIPGKSEFVWRKKIDFNTSNASVKLKSVIANALARRWEGLVLKPVNEPYFGFPYRNGVASCWIKLKKDCIRGHGDTADFLIIGGGYDASSAARSKLPSLSWTHFFVGCIQNKHEVKWENSKPKIIIIDCLSDCMKPEDLKMMNLHGKFHESSVDSSESKMAFDLEFAWADQALPKMSCLFLNPFVLEIAGSGFDKPSNRDLFALRFPRVIKIHSDRDWTDTISFDELQEAALEALKVPSQDLDLEIAEWQRKLDQVGHRTRSKYLAPTESEAEEEEELLEEEVSFIPSMLEQMPVLPTPIASSALCLSPSEASLSSGKHARKQEAQLPEIRKDTDVLQTPPMSFCGIRETNVWSVTRLRERNSAQADPLRSYEDQYINSRNACHHQESSTVCEKLAVQPVQTRALSTNIRDPAETNFPLLEIVNNATRQPGLASEQHTRSVEANLELVRKLGMSAHKKGYQIYQERRRRMKVECTRARQEDTESETSRKSNKKTPSQLSWHEVAVNHRSPSLAAGSPKRARKRPRISCSGPWKDHCKMDIEPKPSSNVVRRDQAMLQASSNNEIVSLSDHDEACNATLVERPSTRHSAEKLHSHLSSLKCSVQIIDSAPPLSESTLIIAQTLSDDACSRLDSLLSHIPNKPIKLSTGAPSIAEVCCDQIKNPQDPCAKHFSYLQDGNASASDCARCLESLIYYLFNIYKDLPSAITSWTYIWHWEALETEVRNRQNPDRKMGVNQRSDRLTEAEKSEMSPHLLGRVKWLHAGKYRHHQSKFQIEWSTGRETIREYKDIHRAINKRRERG